MTHASDSNAQRTAEGYALRILETRLSASFVDGAQLPVALGVKPDGVDVDRKIVVEIFARVGALKSGQTHKVKADLFKLAYIRQQLGPDWKAYFCFVDAAAAASTQGKSWHAQAAKAFGVDVVVIELPAEVRTSVLAAQGAQRMVNAREDD